MSADGAARLGRYLLRSRIAVGGMAEVWLVRQDGPAGFAKDLVVKKILPDLAADAAFVEMFLEEARIASRLNHPNVVQIFELGEEDGAYFIVMELVQGRNLRAVLRRARELNRRVPFGITARILSGAAEGLHHAHEARSPAGVPLGLVHRDVSLENILVSYDGLPKVADFGIAKAAASASRTRPGTVMGKFYTMSMEQALGQPLDRRADVYALGVVLYEMLSGIPPVRVPSDLSTFTKVLAQPIVPLAELVPDIPARLATTVEKALLRDRNARHPTARALAAELEDYLRVDGASMRDVARFITALFPEAHPENGVAPPPPQGTAALTAGPEQAPTVFARGGSSAARRQSGWKTGMLSAGVSTALLLAVSLAVVRPRLMAPSAAARPVPEGAAAPSAPPNAVAPLPVAAKALAAPVEAPAPAPSAPGEPTRGAARALRRGRIVIRVNPWGDIILDGRALGMSPLKPVEASSGTHQLIVANSDLGKTKTVSVRVRPGEDTTVEVNLLH